MKPPLLTLALSAFALPLLFPAGVGAQSDAAKAFFEENLLVDGVCFPYYRPGSAFQRFVRDENGKIDMAEYRDTTGVDVAIWDIRKQAEMLKFIRGVELGHFINVRVIRKATDIETVFRERKQGWLFYTQHPWPLGGTTAPMEGWHRDGLRVLQVVYGSSIPVSPGDELGTGSSRDDADSPGLTPLGREVVAECNRLGIIVEVSHCNKQTTLEVANLSTAPVLCSHAGCEAVTPAKRNKSDEEIRAIAQSGGLIGITPIKFMLTDDAAPGASMAQFIKHLEHAIQIAGIDHVGIASDLKRNGLPESEQIAYTSPELNSQERWFHLYDALKARGYSDEEQAKIFGLNYLRLLKAVLK
ncbi:membrane dipeptidase [Verrucomicrobiales bacterium BCK34]|nr:membrane dipeptidase [Verrucomicrobiales bacterium BCK34]